MGTENEVKKMGFGRIGFQELLVVFGIALLIFGPSKVPEIGKAIGNGIGEFRKASREITKSIDIEDNKE
ncbi:twin-arginine translocase TatA/TatE family subunit [Anoxynatronum buryatiense]|uniref:Sec-independent protein translocase protein TatA n=1 Tax=Anoxynatronum buryatiense TaxID=489973 RepID=A0AA45WYI5_9CLOT|nr:twin-arginine translocase TatA/TatE family subunit [Anoxynatronum buryatiense]SMP63652.1 sec-independent protein translocase protein TatA [Anoxynatronum buryatiense]